MNEQIIDQSVLAEELSTKIPYEFIDCYLVKPLDPIKVTKEFSKPVSTTNKPTKDENGVNAVDYDKVETEVKEVDSDYRKGVILKVPTSVTDDLKGFANTTFSVGTVIIFPDRSKRYFDLLKDSVLVKPWEIVATETVKVDNVND